MNFSGIETTNSLAKRILCRQFSAYTELHAKCAFCESAFYPQVVQGYVGSKGSNKKNDLQGVTTRGAAESDQFLRAQGHTPANIHRGRCARRQQDASASRPKVANSLQGA